MQEDIAKFADAGANIIIATPGRLEDLLLHRESSTLPLALKYLVCLLNFE